MSRTSPFVSDTALRASSGLSSRRLVAEEVPFGVAHGVPLRRGFAVEGAVQPARTATSSNVATSRYAAPPVSDNPSAPFPRICTCERVPSLTEAFVVPSSFQRWSSRYLELENPPEESPEIVPRASPAIVIPGKSAVACVRGDGGGWEVVATGAAVSRKVIC